MSHCSGARKSGEIERGNLGNQSLNPVSGPKYSNGGRVCIRSTFGNCSRVGVSS